MLLSAEEDEDSTRCRFASKAGEKPEGNGGTGFLLGVNSAIEFVSRMSEPERWSGVGGIIIPPFVVVVKVGIGGSIKPENVAPLSYGDAETLFKKSSFISLTAFRKELT